MKQAIKEAHARIRQIEAGERGPGYQAVAQRQADIVAEIVDRPTPANAAAVQPERRPGCSEIEQAVRQVATAQSVAASDLRLIARLRSGRVWQDVLKALPANTPYRDITQACNNVAEQMTQRQAAPAPAPDADIHHGAGRVPPPPLRADDLVEELRPHTETATVAAIELAAHGAYNAVRQRCVTVLTDFLVPRAGSVGRAAAHRQRAHGAGQDGADHGQRRPAAAGVDGATCHGHRGADVRRRGRGPRR